MLQEEIETAKRLVKTDAYQMSIGELVNMYKDGELIINPDFQRLFRWEPGQKSKLIESILLGIPLPPVFVYEKEDSTWELIDGLQRISTVLEFMGLLKDPETKALKAPSYLTSTSYLPSLVNTVWEKSTFIPDIPQADQIELDKGHQLAIRRARIGVEILKRPSDSKTKFDLFQRLNAGGTPANAQELRNCVMIMVSETFYKTVRSLADLQTFRSVITVSEEQLERQRHMEYASRFLVCTFIPYDGKLDVEDYISDGVTILANLPEHEILSYTFTKTFSLLFEALGVDALRRFEDNKHQGRVGLAAFECIAVGVGKNLGAIDGLDDPLDFIRNRISSFWNRPDLPKLFASGLRGTMRIQKTLPVGEQLFAP